MTGLSVSSTWSRLNQTSRVASNCASLTQPRAAVELFTFNLAADALSNISTPYRTYLPERPLWMKTFYLCYAVAAIDNHRTSICHAHAKEK
ncbi:hypothetical protein L484_025657 [Morus notabilis]|uniref:Uncharacterized protein n=1 Tax=Morus notabilis TaxID=981085 RepID=W9RJG4_9ROSA|nr:hypothetical protein L484_025657 [Morus notabilis]